MTPRLSRKLAVLLGLVTIAVPCRVLANTPKVESSYCLAIRDQIKASETAAQATVKKIQAAPARVFGVRTTVSTTPVTTSTTA